MDAIVAVYEDWGIGSEGTQPVALSADRRYFREKTQNAWVIVGRKTLGDFPGGRPLPNRVNLVLTWGNPEIPGARIVHSPGEALADGAEFGGLRSFVYITANRTYKLFHTRILHI